MKNQSVWDLWWTNGQIKSGLIVLRINTDSTKHYAIRCNYLYKAYTNTRKISQSSLFSKPPLDGSKVIQHHRELEECDIDGIRQQKINKEK